MSRKLKPMIDPYWDTQPGIKRLNILRKNWQEDYTHTNMGKLSLLDMLLTKPHDYCSICKDSGWEEYRAPCGPAEEETRKRKCKCKKIKGRV